MAGNTRIKNGVLYQSNVTITFTDSPYTAANIMFILADATASNITITLPDATTVVGATYQIKKIDTGSYTVIVDPYSTQTVDGGLTKVLRAPQETVNVTSDGTNWVIGNSSSSSYLIDTITTGETLDGTKSVILCNNSSDIDVTLPAPASYINRSIIIKKISATGNPPDAIVTVRGDDDITGSNLIDGDDEIKIYTQYTSYTLLSDGSDWHIIDG